MRTLRHKSGLRRGDSDRGSQAFFLIGAMVVIAVVFFLGFQVGRVAEKNASKDRLAAKDVAQSRRDIRKEMSAYSEEAVRIPVVAPPPPPDAGQNLKETEATATFPDSLTRKDPAPEPLVKPKPAQETHGKPRFMLQAGAMKSKDSAQALRRRLEKAGLRTKLVRIEGKGSEPDLYKVRIGPHMSREEAVKAMKEIQSAFKVDVFLLKD